MNIGIFDMSLLPFEYVNYKFYDIMNGDKYGLNSL